MDPMLLALITLAAGSAPPADSLLARLYGSGRSWEEFLAGVNAQRPTWVETYRQAVVDEALVARARAVPGTWRFLVVAEDWCRDSVESIPYLARLVEAVPSLGLRIVTSREGAEVMRRHPTSDGRRATPTIVLLDATSADRGCFVERPAGLRRWIDANRQRLDEPALQRGQRDWYRRDRGREVTREVVDLLEAAASGAPRCDSGSGSTG